MLRDAARKDRFEELRFLKHWDYRNPQRDRKQQKLHIVNTYFLIVKNMDFPIFLRLTKNTDFRKADRGNHVSRFWSVSWHDELTWHVTWHRLAPQDIEAKKTGLLA